MINWPALSQLGSITSRCMGQEPSLLPESYGEERRERAEEIEPISQSQKSNFLSLTNRFHVAVQLFSNRSQMTSKCGMNKKVAHEAIAECVTDVLTTF